MTWIALVLRRRAWLAALVCGFVLCGCKTELYTKRSEHDANQMVGVLLQNGVDAEKATGDNGKSWDVVVERKQVVRALAVLRANGLPQEKYANLGDMFKKDGMISTPTEERVRFIYGVAQELSSTLSKIDGVVAAEVHIVLPNNDPLSTVTKPSSASVFVKYRPDVDITALAPAIKNLVSRSVEGLSYENVTLTLVAGMQTPPPPPPDSAGGTLAWVLGAVAVLLVALLVSIVAVCRLRPQWVPASLARHLGALMRTPAQA